MGKVNSYAAQNETDALRPYAIERRNLRAHDVKIKILYCGVCHSDLHTVRNGWKNTLYPCVPGHEIVGKAIDVGPDVSDFKVGDLVAVGCLVDACRTCESCQQNLEQYCQAGATMTYNGKDPVDGSVTYGGYSSEIVVDDQFVLHIPQQFQEKDLPGVAPLLCAGITTYSPLKHWNIKQGSRVGVVGLGGLGHMAIKLAHAMGAHVVVFTSHTSKLEEAKRLGADEVVNSKDTNSFSTIQQPLDLIIDTVSAPHNLDPYTQLLKLDGVLCLVGVPELPHPSPSVQNLIFGRKSIAGSLIGGLKETQEMLDFCAEHHITADIEMIAIQDIETAYKRMLAGDVKYRFVIDSSTLQVS